MVNQSISSDFGYKHGELVSPVPYPEIIILAVMVERLVISPEPPRKFWKHYCVFFPASYSG
jgi:hypothetical protein